MRVPKDFCGILENLFSEIRRSGRQEENFVLFSVYRGQHAGGAGTGVCGYEKARGGVYGGGLLFGGAFLLTISVVAAGFDGYAGAFVLFGALPYAAYLFLLNLPPFEYAGGKTDMRVLAIF